MPGNLEWFRTRGSRHSRPTGSPSAERQRWRDDWQVQRSVRKFAGPTGLTHLFPSPEASGEREADFGRADNSARAETIRALARAVRGGKIKFEGVVDTDEFLRRLCEIPGIGAWTAQYVAMRALAEPDAFPSSDLGLLRALSLR